MKKSIAALLAIGMIPIGVFAHSDQFILEDVSDNTSFETNVSFLDDISMTIFEVTQALERQSTDILIQNNNSPLASREFVVFLALQKMGISLTQADNEKFWEYFSDVEKESFFAPYINFAKKANIVIGDSNNNFNGKSAISRGELKKIISLTSWENAEKISAIYKNFRNHETNEQDIVLYSAWIEKNMPVMNFSEVYDQVKYVESFDGKNLYRNIDEPIFANIDENGEINFPKIENLAEYSLFFDYKWFPFLAKKVEKLSESDIMVELILRVNQYRMSNGLERLKWNAILSNTASQYAKNMHDTKIFEHKDQNGYRVGDRVLQNGYDYAYALENLGRGHTSVDAIMADWKNSPTHNKNLLSPNVDEIGIGFYGKYWVQIFGREFDNDSIDYSNDV